MVKQGPVWRTLFTSRRYSVVSGSYSLTLWLSSDPTYSYSGAVLNSTAFDSVHTETCVNVQSSFDKLSKVKVMPKKMYSNWFLLPSKTKEEKMAQFVKMTVILSTLYNDRWFIHNNTYSSISWFIFLIMFICILLTKTVKYSVVKYNMNCSRVEIKLPQELYWTTALELIKIIVLTYFSK